MAPNPNIARMAANLLLVLCFLDTWELDEVIITLGMTFVRMTDFPRTFIEYHECLKELMTLGQVSVQHHPTRTLWVSDSIKELLTNTLSIERRRAAFDAAVALISKSWPWVNTYNATDIQRLRIARKLRYHIRHLREICIRFEPGGFVPCLDFCALLQELAALELMQTTVNDMPLACYHFDLPLAHRIIYHYGYQPNTTPSFKGRCYKLLINQARLVGMAASILGKMGEAKELFQRGHELITDRIAAKGLLEDARNMAFHYVESGLHKLRLVDPDHWGALKDVQYAIEIVSEQKGKSVFRFMLPRIIRPLILAHFPRSLNTALDMLQELLIECGHVQLPDLIVLRDVKSLETGILLYAIGKVTYFYTQSKNPDVLRDALRYLRRAVSVLEQTRGEDDIWTLAATYRLAVCLYDMDEYDEALDLLDDLNLHYTNYKGPYMDLSTIDPAEVSDVLWQKARALWKCGQTLLAIGHEDNELEACLMVEDAAGMYWNMCGKFADGYSMMDSSWDENIYFLYR